MKVPSVLHAGLVSPARMQLFAAEGEGSSELALQIQRANRAKKDAEQAEKNARRDAEAAKRADAALGKATSSALDLLQRISTQPARAGELSITSP